MKWQTTRVSWTLIWAVQRKNNNELNPEQAPERGVCSGFLCEGDYSNRNFWLSSRFFRKVITQ